MDFQEFRKKSLVPGNVVSTPFEHFEIVEVHKEAKNIKTLVIESEKIAKTAKPGQYMVLIRPMYDINPMSFSLIDRDKNLVGTTFRVVGDSTQEYAELRKNDKLPIQFAPRGNGFSLRGDRILCIGGGIGIGPLASLIDEAYSRDIKIDCIAGFGTRDEVIFQNRLSEKTKLYVTTDDGTLGQKGTVLSVLDRLKLDYDSVYSCGPEIMMYKVFQHTEKYGLDAQFSLERYIRCGVGLCGSCVIDDLRICSDGPIFSSDQLRNSKDFGKHKKDLDMRTIPIEQQYSKFK